MKVQKSNRSCNSEAQRTKKKDFKLKSLKFCRQPMKQEICTMNWGNKTFRNSIFPKNSCVPDRAQKKQNFHFLVRLSWLPFIISFSDSERIRTVPDTSKCIYAIPTESLNGLWNIRIKFKPPSRHKKDDICLKVIHSYNFTSLIP